jgi:predicted regulator of Ras-like GTPase activity (Roadblock/LC7/MglB family)
VDPVRPPPQDLGRLITDFAGRVPGTLHALVLSSDGVPLAGSGRLEPEQAAQLSAIAAGLISLAGSAARTFDCGAVTQALVAMDRSTLVIMAINDAASLVVHTSAADLDLVAYEMTMLAERADDIVALGADRDSPGPA